MFSKITEHLYAPGAVLRSGAAAGNHRIKAQQESYLVGDR
jgi:hypothetical protein